LGDFIALGPEIARLEDLRITAISERIDLDLELGRHAALVGELEALTQEYPLHERFRAQHMTALYRAGRQVEALRSYERLRRHLADEMGLDPSSELRELENRILSDDDELRASATSATSGTMDPVAVRGYELRDVVATTPSGRSYRAYQRSIGRQVTVKMLGADVADDPEFIATFLSDTKRVAALEHPHIDVVFDTWREPGAAYQVSRWFERGTVADLLTDEIPSPAVALQIVDDVADALGYAHRNGVVHGHVAASNVLLDNSGRAYLSDFVVGRLSDRTPEQDRFDLAALARTLLTTPTGETPPGVDTVFEVAFGEDGYAQPEHLIRAIRQALGIGQITETAVVGRTQLRNPYKGLKAFQELDADDFYGRDGVVERIANQVQHHRLVAVVGPSGSGKSSAVKAGLLPRLRAIDDGTIRLVSEMYPGAYPFEELNDALTRIGTGRTDTYEDLTANERGLARVLRNFLPSDDSELILVIDQFEELFSMLTDEATRQLFLDSLVSAVTDPKARLRVIVTMRADFFDRPLTHPEFGELFERALVPVTVPNNTELAEAIAKPAAAVGVTFEPGLVDHIVSDIEGQPGALPLLQYALTELFDDRDADVITLAAYQRGGGVLAALGRRAEQLHNELPSDGKDAIRHALLQMVSVDENTDDLRRRVRRADLRSAAIDDRTLEHALQTYGAHRLLTFDLDPSTSTPTVEVAHEALLREWPRLRQWVESQRDDLVVRRRLDVALAEWEAAGEEDSFLPTGGRLAQFEEWSRTTSLAIGIEELSFIGRAVERETSVRVRAAARRRRFSIGLGVAAALFAVVAVFALLQKRSADREAETAQAAVVEANLATLVSRSAAQSVANPELSVLLALEAHRRAPSSETEHAVLNALGSARSPNRIASFPGFDVVTHGCQWQEQLSLDGLWMHAVVDGRLMRRDLTTGEVSDQGAATERCGIYIGDPIAGWAAVGNVDGETNFVGSYDDPYMIELEHDGPIYLSTAMDLSTGVAFGYTQLEPREWAVVAFDATTGAQIAGPIGEGAWWTDAMDPSGSFLAVSHEDAQGRGHLRIVDVTTGAERFHIETTDPASSIAFDLRDQELVAGTRSGSLMTVDLQNGEIVSVVETGATSPIREVAVRSNGLIRALTEGQVETVDRHSGPTGNSTNLRDGSKTWMRDDGLILIRRSDDSHDLIDLDGTALVERSWPVDADVVAYDTGLATLHTFLSETASVVDLATGERTAVELRDREGNDFAVARLYPDADALLGVGLRGVMARWEGGDMVERVDLPGPLTTWYRVGDMIASIGVDADGDEVATLSSLERGSAGIRFTVSATDGTSAYPALDGGIHVFDADGMMRTYDADGELINEFDTGIASIWLIAADSATGMLAAASRQSAVVLIDPLTGEVAALAGGPGNLVNLGFAQGGRLLVITAADGDVTIWDVEHRRLVGTAWDGTGAVTSPQSWYDESTGSVWVFTSGRMIEIPLAAQQWIERACSFVNRDLTADEWTRYVPGDATPVSACE
jgi:serine/threonine protein kinase/WD40 repeat protein